jgi:hypothetical protein
LAFCLFLIPLIVLRDARVSKVTTPGQQDTTMTREPGIYFAHLRVGQVCEIVNLALVVLLVLLVLTVRNANPSLYNCVS